MISFLATVAMICGFILLFTGCLILRVVRDSNKVERETGFKAGTQAHWNELMFRWRYHR